MQGQGLSLTAAEKLRVAFELDRLGDGVIEAGFPPPTPRSSSSSRCSNGERSPRARSPAFGMTRRRDVAASDDPGLRVLAESFAPIATIVGKTWGLHLEKDVRVAATRTSRSSPTRSPPRRSGASGSRTDASTYSTPSATIRVHPRLPAGGRRGRGGCALALRHQRLLAARSRR